MSSLFGGGSTPQVSFTPSGFVNHTGFSVSGQGGVTESPTLQSNIGGLQQTFQNASSAFGALGATVKPGFSQFRLAGLTDIANQFMKQRSNLQDTLAQRRILGSSFANAQFSDLAATEAQTKADFEANSYLQELQASMQTTQAQFTAQAQSYSSAIAQTNIESATAASLTASNNQIGAQIASANAQLQASAQAGAGSFIGSLIGAGASLGGSYMTSTGLGSLASALGGSAAAGGGAAASDVAIAAGLAL